MVTLTILLLGATPNSPSFTDLARALGPDFVQATATSSKRDLSATPTTPALDGKRRAEVLRQLAETFVHRALPQRLSSLADAATGPVKQALLDRAAALKKAPASTPKELRAVAGGEFRMDPHVPFGTLEPALHVLNVLADLLDPTMTYQTGASLGLSQQAQDRAMAAELGEYLGRWNSQPSGTVAVPERAATPAR
ncbi:MAG: hypothetical protein SFW67_10695 [Myxococcaceae bacterium]|nr:hypothetical protein [Myxococcaceae bacterium]